MPITFTWRDQTTLPVDADGLNPTELDGLSADAVARRTLRVGNARIEIGALFEVRGAGDDSVRIAGDLRHLRGVGRGLARGRIDVDGNVGAHLGAGMSGGAIVVTGDVGDYAGAEMSGGMIRIRGDGGRAIGAAYPGSRLGMREGVILVEGSVAEETGRRMRRGLIAVRGNAADGFGRNLIAGTLMAFGAVGRGAGSGMKRGTLVLAAETGAELLPGFVSSGRHRFPFLNLYLRRLREWGFAVPSRMFSAEFERYNGDLAEGGRGEVLAFSR